MENVIKTTFKELPIDGMFYIPDDLTITLFKRGDDLASAYNDADEYTGLYDFCAEDLIVPAVEAP